MAGTDKTKPFLTPDWTQMDGRSKPFYQAAKGSLPERYSVTVLSQYDTTGGTKRQDRMNEAIQPGLNRILKYYSKISSGSMSDAQAEDFFMPLRPKAKMKVLVSFPCAALEILPDKKLTLSADKRSQFEIQLNTSDIKPKLDVATTSIVKYGEEIEKFHGKVYGFDYNKESSKLLGFMPALIQLMLDNDIVFSEADSNLVTLLATNEYEVIYATLNRGSGPIVLSKGFDTFIANQSVKHKRVIKILSQLNELEQTIINNKNLSWSQFFKRFIYNPPKFDFSTPRPSSPTLKEKIAKELEKNNDNPVKTSEQVHLFAGFVDLPENNKALVDFSEKASVFIGDSIIGNLDQLGNTLGDIGAIFGDVLNATGLDDILKSALDCLDINTEWGLGDASEGLLDSINQLFSQVEGGLPHNIPTIDLPDDFKISNLLADIGMAILKAVVGAVIGALIALLQELIKLLFQFCSECSIRTEDGYIKKYNKLNFGSNTGLSWGKFAGTILGSGAMWEGASHRLAGGVIGGFRSSQWGGNQDAFQQDVLKNGINNIDRLYDHEAQRIFDILKSGVSGETHALYSGTGRTGYFTGTEQAKNTLAFQFGSTPAELNKSGFNKDMTLAQVLEIVKRKSPWSAAVFQEASRQLSEYLDAVLTSWTPGEIGNAMLGCGIAPDAKEVARNALPAYPALDLTLRGDDDDGTDDNLADVWATMGKMVGHEPVLKAIAQLAEDVPERLKCLSDIDDTSLRKRLLGEKDPTLSPEEIADQVAKAKKRNRDKIKEISDLIGRDDILQGKMPPLHCSQSADGTIIPGILPVTHPTTTFALRRALDTTYDSLKMTFNNDVSSWVPALSIKTLTPVEVQRTTVIKGGVFGWGGERIFTPDFKRMVQEGLVTYGSLPEGAIVPNSRTPPEERDDPFDPDDDGDPTEIHYNWFLQAFSDEWSNKAGKGMWEEGQTKPTPDQEHEWEMANIKFSASYENGRFVGIEFGGGRRWKPQEGFYGQNPYYGKTWDGKELTMVDYTKKFGYSPIPIHELKEGPPHFLPGVKDTLQNMCDNENLFNIKLGRENRYSFFIPNNMFKNAGVDFNEIQKNMDEFRGDLVDKIKVDGIWENVKGSFNAIANSKFNIQYVVPSFAGSIEIPKDEYYINFSIDTPDLPDKGDEAFSTLNLPGIKDSLNLPEPARKVIENQSLAVLKNPAKPQETVQPQVGLFYDFSNHVWETGGTVYRNGVKVQGNNELPFLTIPRKGTNNSTSFTAEQIAQPYGNTENQTAKESTDDMTMAQTSGGGAMSPSGISDVTFESAGTLKNAFVESLYSQDTYKNLFKDLFCSFTNQLAESPYLQLQRSDDGKPGMLSVNLTPVKVQGWDPSCQKTLLDVDLIKDQIMREQELIRCIKRDWRVEENPASNRGAPRQIASRSGCILLTIRTYVIEYLLRFAYSFHYFTPSSPNDVDQTSIYHVYSRLSQELLARGLGTEYAVAFQKETIELYNRNKPTIEQLGFETEQATPTSQIWYKNFRKALEPLIRYQIYSVSRRFSRDFMDLRGDVDGGDPHSILIQEWLPTVEPAKIRNELRFSNLDGTNKILKNFNDTTGIRTVTLNELAATMPGGTLTDEAIEQMPDPFRNERQSHAIGKLFRDYFFPNRNFEEFREWTGGNRLWTAERLWPVHAYGSHPRVDSNGKLTWLREPVMIGSGRESNILAPASRVSGDIGVLLTPRAVAANTNLLATRNLYPLGVSVSEKNAMDRITQMMYAAQFWTLNKTKKIPIHPMTFQEVSALGGRVGEDTRKSLDTAANFFKEGNSFVATMDFVTEPLDRAAIDASLEEVEKDAANNHREARDAFIKAGIPNYDVVCKTRGQSSRPSPYYPRYSDECMDAKKRLGEQFDREHPLSEFKAAAEKSFRESEAPLGNPAKQWLNGLPFWAADKKRASLNIISWADSGFSEETTGFGSEAITAKSKYHGPGSLLRWMTTKKAIFSFDASQTIHSHEPGEKINPWGLATAILTWGISDALGYSAYEEVEHADVHTMFPGHGLTWNIAPSYPEPVGWIARPGTLDTQITTQAAAHTFGTLNSPKVWMNPYPGHLFDPDTNRHTKWNPETPNMFNIGMPDLPQGYLDRLGIPAVGETDIEFYSGEGAVSLGQGFELGGGRSSHLLFYLLPQSHWLGLTQPGKRSKWFQNVASAIHKNQKGYTQYISLLDLHPDAVRRALIWEQGMYANFVSLLSGDPIGKDDAGRRWMPSEYYDYRTQKTTNDPRREEEIKFYTRLVFKYNTWIQQWEEVMEDLKAGKEERRCIQEKSLAIINSGKLPRNNMKVPPMYDIDEGSPILEPYVRVIDYTTEEAEALGIKDNVSWAKLRPELTKGVVNIDKWDEFMQSRFGESATTAHSQKRTVTGKSLAASPSDEDCGDDLPSRKDRVLQSDEVINLELQLKDYFKEIHYGLRIMYLPKPNDFSDTLTPEKIDSSFVIHEKAFWIKETFENSTDGPKSRWLNPYPLVATETPVNMMLTVAEASTLKKDGTLAAVNDIIEGCTTIPGKPAEDIYTGFFRWTFKSIVGNERFSSPRDVLQKNIINTDEYKFLFKYCFPLDRMLSLLNVYSSTYLASLPDIQYVFEPTKHDLMGIFMRSLRSGDWKNACQTGNIDVLEALMNGMTLPWGALLQMALKWPMLIFKGFMEQADINIAISKNIQKAIKLMNATIATIQTQANAVQQAGASMYSSMEQLTGAEASGSCGIGVNLPDPRKPPDALFDPIEDNLLYVPETWMIGLALLPSTIFAPYLWGPPISIPHGLAYWALDDSHINWLNAFPDFPNDLWGRKDDLLKEALTKQDCPPDFDSTNIFKNGGNNDY